MAQLSVHGKGILPYKTSVTLLSVLLFKIVKCQGKEGSRLTIFS